MKVKELITKVKYGTNIRLYDKEVLIDLPSDLPTRVEGFFDCGLNNLISLEHCPTYIGTYFDCSNNKIVSLEHGPIDVGDYFKCSVNQLVSLEHCPTSVGGFFHCSKNKITDFKNIHKQLKKVGGQFICEYNPIVSHILGLVLIERITRISSKLEPLKLLNKHLNEKDILEAQEELITNKFKEFAKL
jgi:hypothetical protein